MGECRFVHQQLQRQHHHHHHSQQQLASSLIHDGSHIRAMRNIETQIELLQQKILQTTSATERQKFQSALVRLEELEIRHAIAALKSKGRMQEVQLLRAKMAQLEKKLMPPPPQQQFKSSWRTSNRPNHYTSHNGQKRPENRQLFARQTLQVLTKSMPGVGNNTKVGQQTSNTPRRSPDAVKVARKQLSSAIKRDKVRDMEWILGRRSTRFVHQTMPEGAGHAGTTTRTGNGLFLDTASIHRRNGRILNCADEKGWTPLVQAIMTGNLKAVCLLIECGADPNLESLKTVAGEGSMPLHVASHQGFAKAVDALLIDAGANPMARQKDDGYTFLHCAAKMYDESNKLQVFHCPVCIYGIAHVLCFAFRLPGRVRT